MTLDARIKGSGDLTRTLEVQVHFSVVTVLYAPVYAAQPHSVREPGTRYEEQTPKTESKGR
jgi:hypothetical protein